MDDTDEHWKEILRMAKDNHQRQQTPIKELDVDRLAQLERNVFAHIEQQFNSVETEGIRQSSTTSDTTRKKSIWASAVSGLRKLQPRSLSDGHLAALAFGAIGAISVGLLITNDKTVDSPFEVPNSLLTAGLGSQVILTGGGQRALTSTTTDRRVAFISGTVQADLDVLEIPNDEYVANLANQYPVLFGESVEDSTEQLLNAFQSQVKIQRKDDQLNPWLQEGYLVQMIHLSAQAALIELNTGTLNDALQHFRSQQDLESAVTNSEALNPNYSDSRNKIVDTGVNEVSTPDDIQQIIDLTQTLKVLAN